MYVEATSTFPGKAEYQAQSVQPRQPLLAEIGARLSRLQDEIGAADRQSSELRERLFGPWPVADQANGVAGKSSQSDEILRALDSLIERAASVYANISVLNSGI